MDGFQSAGQARPDQRPDQGRTQRPDRVSEDAMKAILTIAMMVMLLGCANGAAAPDERYCAKEFARMRVRSRRPLIPAMPRFRFENFTTANGLPDDHVFSVLVDGDRIWAGTENGLGLYENHQWKTFTTKDGLAHRAVLVAGARQAHRRCVGGDDGRVEPHFRWTHRHLHAIEFGTEQRRGVWRVGGGRERVGGDGCGRHASSICTPGSGRSTTSATRR